MMKPFEPSLWVPPARAERSGFEKSTKEGAKTNRFGQNFLPRHGGPTGA